MYTNRKRLYRTIFLYVTLSILSTLAVTAAVLYLNFEKIATEQLYAGDEATLSRIADNVSGLVKLAETIANQIYTDPQVSRLRFYANPDANTLRLAGSQLTSYRFSLPFIDSIYVYNGQQGMFYVNARLEAQQVRETIQDWAGFDDPFARDLIRAYRSYKPYIPVPRRFVAKGFDRAGKNYYTFLIYDAFLLDGISSAVIVNVAGDWITNFIAANSAEPNSHTIIVDSEGKVVSDSDAYPMLTSLAVEPFMRRIFAAEEGGAVVASVDGKSCLISWTAPDDLGWRYVKVTLREYVFRGIEKMKSLTMLAALLFFALGVGAALIASRSIYRPIDNLMTDLRELTAEEKRNETIIKQAFLRDLTLGRGLIDENSFAVKAEELGIGFNAAGEFRVVLLRIDQYQAFSRERSAIDQGLVKAAIRELGSAALSPGCVCETLEIGNDSVVALLNGPSGAEALASDAIVQRLTRLQADLVGNLALSVSGTISSAVFGIERLSQAYNRTYEASMYRLFRGRGCVIASDGMAVEEFDKFEFPAAQEKLLVSALSAGKTEEAGQLYDGIMAEAKNYPFTGFNVLLSHLAFVVNDTVRSVMKYNGIDLDIQHVISATQLTQVETIEEINARFHTVFADIGALLRDKKSNRNEQLVERINRHIEENYMSGDLYIESIAENQGKSPTYICHVYKQCTGTTILDKIVSVRMQKAKDLLRTTKSSVAEIADRTGFTSSAYFFKVFKKINGLTPNAFRESEAGS